MTPQSQNGHSKNGVSTRNLGTPSAEEKKKKPLPESSPLQKRYRTDRYSLERSVVITTYRSSRPGGQRRDKTETAVRLLHRPSGIVVTASERRSQAQNREIAFERLRKRLEQLNRPRKVRRPTKRPRAADKRRLDDKARQSQKKRRRKVSDQEY